MLSPQVHLKSRGAFGDAFDRGGRSTSGPAPLDPRFYEEAGILPAPQRVGRRRQYGPEAVAVLRVVLAARETGFSIAEVQRLVEGLADGSPLSARWHAMAVDKPEEMDRLIARAEAMKSLLRRGLECGSLGPQDCLLAAGDQPQR